ncbi:ABC transporter ATP-binding protein [Clostridium sp. Marseille-P299]|uniref:ABC transporter ATP-binding protein n=1 Tax=Clostridium sp. Marseille-P299 TaxID=1805477 RepID=UPI00082C8D11|nr:ABC transporter ATP-binding protein [Clostridium sp. Marseille-P299]
MEELLWKRRGKFIQYLIASFMFNIERFINMGLFALILGAVEKGEKSNYIYVVIITMVACIYMGANFIISRMLRIGYMRDTILDVRKQAFDKIIGMSFKQFSKKSKEVYISNLINDINTFESKFFISLLNYLINISMFVLCFLCLVFMEPILAVVMLFVSIILYGISRIFSNKTVSLQGEVSTLNEEFTTEMGNTFNGLEILKLNRIEDKFLQKSLDSIKKVERKKNWFNIFSEGQRSLINIVGYVIMCGVMIYLCLGFQNGMSLAKATFIFQLASAMSFNLIEAFPLWNTIKASVNIYEKITSVQEKNEVKASEYQSGDFSDVKEIKVDHVKFAYENTEILKDANFTIEKGKKYLIKGVSGAGKSTLMNLLAKTYDNYEGAILADGIEYKNIEDKKFQDKVAFIYQDVFLFEDSIRNNITLYKEIPNERIQFAVKACQLDTLIADKALGLDEVLLENGKNLSGGQRQRISIARAIAKEAEILFVDEGTSSLNEELGKEIEKLFLSLEQTVIAISHRYYEGVTEQYDYILEIKNGRVNQYAAKDYFGEAITC